ncbi:MAG TPA: aminoglycoside phosphotransferase family protein [Acidimicrobiales bacterium]|nr:aminoglycoside phosphotransferase family protein [Acidimicrobiales bacterium]
MADALAVGWDLPVTSVAYLPVGFGSHHWSVRTGSGERWFLTVDDLEAKRHSADEPPTRGHARLDAALRTARELRDAGLDFVVAPVPTSDGELLVPIDDRYVAALYPHIDGCGHGYGEYDSDTDRREVVDLLVALHTTAVETAPGAGHEDYSIRTRDDLEQALDDTGQPWDSGPYAMRARLLLAERAPLVDALLRRYDELVASATGDPDHLAITHGEPHAANTMSTDAGRVLIDWDTALIGPPERDLWMVIDEGDPLVATYEARTGTRVAGALLELYRMLWDLTEIAGYVTYFRAQHTDTSDAAESWVNLVDHIDIASRWPAIS